jgi:hypothetical protein
MDRLWKSPLSEQTATDPRGSHRIGIKAKPPDDYYC